MTQLADSSDAGLGGLDACAAELNEGGGTLGALCNDVNVELGVLKLLKDGVELSDGLSKRGVGGDLLHTRQSVVVAKMRTMLGNLGGEGEQLPFPRGVDRELMRLERRADADHEPSKGVSGEQPLGVFLRDDKRELVVSSIEVQT
jgi:hypothetical protein